MTLKLKNTWDFKGDDRWDWAAYVDDGGTGELDKVETVEYILHPTFKNPRRTVADRGSKFLMKTNGWGEFELVAFIQLKDGTKKRLKHEVILKSSPPTGTSK